MKMANKLVALLLMPACLLTSPTLAQQSRILDAATLSQALDNRDDAVRAQRAQVQRVLDRADVQAVASRMGLRAADAASAVATLSGTDLQDAAQRAAAIETAALSGGSNTVVISTTTLLLVIIIVILLAR